MVRRLIPFLLALVLGAGAAVLVACGEGGTKGGIPGGAADRLDSDFEDVQQAVDGGRCRDLNGQLGQVDRRIDRLSQDNVDERLVDRLRQASDNLHGRAPDDCDADKPKTKPDTQTETQETVTTVAPEPEPDTQTQTTPPKTQTTPGAGGSETTTTPAPGVPPDSDGDTVPQGGGVQPQVPPP